MSTLVEADLSETRSDKAKYTTPPKPKQQQARLTRAQTLGLIERYRAGETVYQLGDAYNINRKTVSTILKRNGVTMRWRRLSPTDIDKAVQLYQTGLSLQATGQRLGVDHSTIRHHLEQRGITRCDVGTNQWS